MVLKSSWACECSFGEADESTDMAPPGTSFRKKKSGSGRPFVKTHYLLFALQMIIGFVPAMFVSLSSRTA
uniref:Transmembrane protein n=1 Tax=Globodera pallida TaxID=36090 RepID=A0A183BPY3_GLOPA